MIVDDMAVSREHLLKHDRTKKKATLDKVGCLRSVLSQLGWSKSLGK